MIQNPIADAILRAFDLWAANDAKHKKIYKGCTEGTKEIVNTAFSEMLDYRPATFEAWWLTHHMRFSKRLKQTDFKSARSLVYPFLTKYVRGELSYESKRPRRKARGSAPTISNRAHHDDSV